MDSAAKMGRLIYYNHCSQDPPCPWNTLTCIYAKNYEYQHILDWLDSLPTDKLPPPIEMHII